ncbi:putative pol polyprotein [Operophtera brumata]|uniref:Putative pol polyprotein n=1 Tax=Operophtera brumata TaxID=104452 RepID=A0A0L7KW86_OPEBR|nr:putative pol polyprotein [Operophtera brumata]
MVSLIVKIGRIGCIPLAFVIPGMEPNFVLGIDFWRKFQLCPKYINSIVTCNNNLNSEFTLSPSHQTFVQSYASLNDPSKFPNFFIKNNTLYRLSKNKHELTSEFSWKEVMLGEMGRPKQCSRLFQMISIDLMGPLPTTKQRNNYILVRYNRTIITCISTYVDDDHRSWDLFIPRVQFAINNSVNEATGYTQSFLVFGRELVTCGTHFTDNDLGSEILFLPRDPYAENLGCLSNIFDTVQSKLWQAHVKNTSQYNLRRKFAEFNVGDVVMKRAYFLSDKENQFSKKFIKAKIITKKSPLVYVLQDMSGKNLGSWHIKDLKLVGLNK